MEPAVPLSSRRNLQGGQRYVTVTFWRCGDSDPHPVGVQVMVGGHAMPAGGRPSAHPPRHAGGKIDPDGRCAAEERGGGLEVQENFIVTGSYSNFYCNFALLFVPKSGRAEGEQQTY